MFLHAAFANVTRVEKIKGEGPGRQGLVVEVNHQSGRFRAIFDDTHEDEWCDPTEFRSLPKKRVKDKSEKVNHHIVK